MDNEIFMQLHLLNQSLQKLFEIVECKNQKVKEKDFSEAIVLRNAEKKYTKTIFSYFYKLECERFPIKLYLSNLESRDADSILLKNIDQFIYFIKKFGLPKSIIFNLILGLDISGYDCAKWLVIYCLEENKRLPEYQLIMVDSDEKDKIDFLFLSFKRRVDRE